MSRIARPSWFVVSALLILTAILSSCSTTLAEWYREANKPQPSLVVDLDSDPEIPGIKEYWQQRGSKLAARIERRFPIGSPAGPLRKELQHQGFSADWSFEPGEEHASFSSSNFVCLSTDEVWWRVDSRDRLTAIRGQSGSACF